MERAAKWEAAASNPGTLLYSGHFESSESAASDVAGEPTGPSATDKDTVAAQGATAPEASATPDVVSAAPPPSKPLSVIERIRLARANLGVE